MIRYIKQMDFTDCLIMVFEGIMLIAFMASSTVALLAFAALMGAI